MTHLQIISRSAHDLHSLIRKAITDGQFKTFEILKIKGGLIINHKKYPGVIKLNRSRGPLLATVICKPRSKEFRLLESFVGRLADHFPNEIAAINIQLSPTDDTAL